jgi:hypothetical protein
LGYTCCDACGRLFVKGNYCPVCLKVQMLCSQYQNDLFELFEIYYALFNFGVSIFSCLCLTTLQYSGCLRKVFCEGSFSFIL